MVRWALSIWCATTSSYLVSLEQGFGRVGSRNSRSKSLLVHLEELAHTDSIVSVQVALGKCRRLHEIFLICFSKASRDLSGVEIICLAHLAIQIWRVDVCVAFLNNWKVNCQPLKIGVWKLNKHKSILEKVLLNNWILFNLSKCSLKIDEIRQF